MGTKKLGNSPKMLMFQLLYVEQPNVVVEAVVEQLRKIYPSVEYNEQAKGLIFPEIEIEYENHRGPAQCVIMAGEQYERAALEEAFLQQNWHWNEAAEVEQMCAYSLSVSDFMSRGLEPRVRIVLLQQVLLAFVKVTKPSAIVSIHGEKLIDPAVFEADCQDPNYVALDLVANVRLFNINNPEYKQFLMDTIGLHSLGLSDFQLFFDQKEYIEAVASRLWDYAYYTMQVGDVIDQGHTIEGLEEGSKWDCTKEYSASQPKRTIINIEAKE